MASGQGYIETQNPGLMSLVVGSRSSGMNPTKMSGIGNGKPTERYATYSEVYGPFREDSMELKEETAYQRGMKEHIRENMESINKLNMLQDPLLTTGYQQRSETSSSVDSLDQPFYAGSGMMDDSQGTHPAQFHRSMVDTTGAYNELDLTEDFVSPYRPKVTYVELAQKTPRKPPPPPSRTYTEMLMVPKTYSTMKARDVEEEGETAPSFDVTYLQRNPSTPKFGVSSLPIGWKANALSPPEELWEKRAQGLGKFANRNVRGNNRSLDLNTSRNPHMPGNSTFPLATVRLPALSNAQSMPSLHTVDRYQGNTNPGKLNIDINLKMDSKRDDNVYGQNKYSSEMVYGNSYNSVPPLVLNPLTSLPPVPFNPQLSVPLQYQPFSNRNSVQVNQQMMDVTPGVGSTIYPYRQMNNPWFPPQDDLPTVRKNLRRGKYGNYRVFGIHDYKKLQKELRLGSLVGQQKDVETMQEKKEKRAILQEYGRLVRAKNREEMRPPLPL